MDFALAVIFADGLAASYLHKVFEMETMSLFAFLLVLRNVAAVLAARSFPSTLHLWVPVSRQRRKATQPTSHCGKTVAPHKGRHYHHYQKIVQFVVVFASFDADTLTLGLLGFLGDWLQVVLELHSRLSRVA